MCKNVATTFAIYLVHKYRITTVKQTLTEKIMAIDISKAEHPEEKASREEKIMAAA